MEKNDCEVNTLGLLNSVSDWMAARQEKKINEMETLGYCPDCHGKGFNTYNVYEFYYTNPYDCLSCNGSGSFDDWYENTQ